jgi:lipopolysaccharide transport system ATP-binding protein
MKPAIEVKNLSKKFKIDRNGESYLSLRDSFKHVFKKKSKEDFYALRDINFTVNEGDSVGIIGKNGAGKSTLLKIISKITPPSEGSIIYRGRVASLLEVGTGFHGELTGRENVFMNGSILGMKRTEIKKNFDAIVDFAGVEKFIDTPLKHYSSGMQLRLAFAVAAFLENEILIIDEVLAVGDVEFQKKCIGKMGEISKNGRTLLFVSHNMSAINSLCSSGVLLAKGSVVFQGPTQAVTQLYLNEHANFHFSKLWNAKDEVGEVVPRSLRLLNEDGTQCEMVKVNEKFGIEFVYEVQALEIKALPNIHFKTAMEEYVFIAIDNTSQEIKEKGVYKSVVWIPANFLNGGLYTIGMALSSINPVKVHWSDYDALSFEVIDDFAAVTRGGYSGSFLGPIRPLLDWSSGKL